MCVHFFRIQARRRFLCHILGVLILERDTVNQTLLWYRCWRIIWRTIWKVWKARQRWQWWSWGTPRSLKKGPICHWIWEELHYFWHLRCIMHHHELWYFGFWYFHRQYSWRLHLLDSRVILQKSDSMPFHAYIRIWCSVWLVLSQRSCQFQVSLNWWQEEPRLIADIQARKLYVRCTVSMCVYTYTIWIYMIRVTIPRRHGTPSL